MRFALLVKADERSEAGVMPTQKEFEEMGALNEEMAKAGVMLAGEGLHPSSKGARVTFSEGTPIVTNGPFPSPDQLVGGYWVIEVASIEEAIGWARRVPFENGEIEIRQVAEAEDFGDEFTPELREQEERIRAQAAANN
jgi:hypothetical protein